MTRPRKRPTWQPPTVTLIPRELPISETTALNATTADWIDKVRQAEGALLQLFGNLTLLAKYGAGRGFVFVDGATVTTNLTTANFSGGNAGLDPGEFVAAFAGLMSVISAVPDELAGALMKNSYGGLK